MSKPVKIIYALFGLGILFSILHNMVDAIFRVEEPVFFMIGILCLLGFAVFLVYNLIRYLVKNKPEDVWKLGYLGLFGLVGFIPGFKCGFFVFFCLFAFFRAKR